MAPSQLWKGAILLIHKEQHIHANRFLSSHDPARRRASRRPQETANMLDISGKTASQRMIWRIAVILAPLALACTACGGGESQARQAAKGPTAVRIEVTSVQHITVQRQVELSGTLISPDLAKVSSEVAGRVQEMLIEMGQEVQPGQVLVKLDPR